MIRRLRTIVHLLQHDESIEATDYKGLDALCLSLAKFVEHRDKEVRLYTVAACMELFAIYAPDAPWGTEQTLQIFRQTIRQLANLAHCLAGGNFFHVYTRILELLAEVKIGVVLVDLAKEQAFEEEENFDPDDTAISVLADLFRTVLQSVRNEHPREVSELVQKTVSACLEEYYDGAVIPIPLLDELLVCIGQGQFYSLFRCAI